MKFKKVIIDGQEYYQKVSDEKENLREDFEENFEENFGEEIKQKTKNFNNNIQDFVNNILEQTSEIVEEATKPYKKKNKKAEKRSSKASRILNMLPYMDDEDIEELVEKILEDDELAKEIDLSSVLPYVDDDFCDKLFLKQLDLDENSPIIDDMIIYVSEECLSEVVDNYINGQYQNLEIDKFYPYLDSDDVKKLFYYELKKKTN